jgi:hypothetical protein
VIFCLASALLGGLIGFAIAASCNSSDPRFVRDAEELWRLRHWAQAYDAKLEADGREATSLDYDFAIVQINPKAK